MIPDFAVRQALAALHPGSCGCLDFCREGGGAAGREVCTCFCHIGQPLTAAQRSAAATRIAPAHDAARLRALQILLLVGSPAARDTVEVRA